MKKIITILLLMLLESCDKPDETIYETTDPLICVDCWDQISHISFIDVFCGENDECDRFIVEAKETAKQKGMYLYCVKKK